MTALHFTGDWSPWFGVPVALAAAAGVWFWYRRDIAGREGPVRWLPRLRALAVFLLVLTLTGPVLRHRTVVGELARILVFVDASRSMSAQDEGLEPGRKLLVLHRLGRFDEPAIDWSLADAAAHAAEVRNLAAGLRTRSADAEKRTAVLAETTAQAEKAVARLREAKKREGAAVAPRGAVVAERWTGVDGRLVEQLRPLLGTPPKETLPLLQALEIPADAADQYGSRIRGWLHPPATGDYILWIASDDQGELWLSTGATEAGKKVVAKVETWTPVRNWDKEPSQKSAPVRLNAGERYWFEALHKEGGGGDNLALGWQLPDGTLERPIPVSRASGGGAAAAATGDLAAQLAADLVEPARKLAAAAEGKADALDALAGAAAQWDAALRRLFETDVATWLAASPARAKMAVRDFDSLTRWQRLSALLLEGEKPLLKEFATRHDVELIALAGTGAEPLWQGMAGRIDGKSGEIPAAFTRDPDAPATDLSGPVLEAAGLAGEAAPANGGPRTAAVLLTDGRHNDGPAPIGTAKVLGLRGVPVFTASFGAAQRAGDLAILGADLPRTVFHKDKVKGKIRLGTELPAGAAITLRIECEGELLFEQKLAADGAPRREVEVEFPVEAAVRRRQTAESGIERSAVPLLLNLALPVLPGDAEPRNNTLRVPVLATVRKSRVLLLDGRPRWEHRYVRNFLERGDRWEVTALLPVPSRLGGGWTRGTGPKDLPGSKEALFGFDLILLGELPPGLLKPEELGWFKDFVGDRAGGLILLDGSRGELRREAGGPLDALLPVTWESAPPAAATALRLSPAGEALASLRLGDAAANPALWAELASPRRAPSVAVRAGAETLAETRIGADWKPFLVTRRYGAGRVVWLGGDEFWRWRRKHGDTLQERFWCQLADWAAEPPFAVQDKRVSLDAGPPLVRPGETAPIRARLRDAQGRPVADGQAKAVLYRDGRKAGEVALAADENGGGLYRATTGRLAAGRYEIALLSPSLPGGESKARAEIFVGDLDGGEFADLSVDEELLRRMAEESGGAFFREEDAGLLADRLAPLSQGKVLETETALWQSYAWFVPILLLLLLEWILRKRAGML